MGEQEGYFEMVVLTELIEQELAALRHWIDLRKQAIDQCRNCPSPPADVMKQLWVTGDDPWRRLGQINRLAAGKEATSQIQNNEARVVGMPRAGQSQMAA